MKKIIAAFAGLMMMVASATSYGIEATGYRFLIESSVDGETPVVITEIEYLWDDDDDSLTADVDGTDKDLGVAGCGWRCDSVASNRQGTPSSDFPGETRSRRQVRVMFDNSFTTDFTLNNASSAGTPYYVQYTIYPGVSDPVRTRPDVTAYSIVVPSSSISTGAPLAWTLEYFDSDLNAWALLDEQTENDVNWTSAGNVYNASAVFYLVDTSGTYLWDGTDWGDALTGTALTDAATAISGGTRIGRHLKFSL